MIDRLPTSPPYQAPEPVAGRRETTDDGGAFARLVDAHPSAAGSENTGVSPPQPESNDVTVPTGVVLGSPAAELQQVGEGHLPTVDVIGMANATGVSIISVRTGALGEETLESLPWQLRANAGLSYASRAQQSIAVVTADTSSLVEPSSDDTANARPQGTVPAVAVPLASGLPVEQVATVSQLEASHGSATRLAATERIARAAADLSAATHWPERLLRWVADGDAAGATVWVRDYTLDASGADALLADVLRESAARGTPVRRVMVNGHELWRAPVKND